MTYEYYNPCIWVHRWTLLVKEANKREVIIVCPENIFWFNLKKKKNMKSKKQICRITSLIRNIQVCQRWKLVEKIYTNHCKCTRTLSIIYWDPCLSFINILISYQGNTKFSWKYSRVPVSSKIHRYFHVLTSHNVCIRL